MTQYFLLKKSQLTKQWLAFSGAPTILLVFSLGRVKKSFSRAVYTLQDDKRDI